MTNYIAYDAKGEVTRLDNAKKFGFVQHWHMGQVVSVHFKVDPAVVKSKIAIGDWVKISVYQEHGEKATCTSVIKIKGEVTAPVTPELVASAVPAPKPKSAPKAKAPTAASKPTVDASVCKPTPAIK
jgi:hypothetical protein